MGDFRRRRYKKNFYSFPPWKKAKPNVLQPGMKGVLITCNTNEKMCVREAYSLLNEYANRLFGPEQFPQKSDESDDNVEGVESQNKKEEQSFKSTKTARRFQQVNTRVRNCIFIRTLIPDPDLLVHSIFEDVKSSKQRKGRFILRMVPVTVTCKAFLEHIKRGILNLVGHYPAINSRDHVAYMMVYKARNNHHLLRDEVFCLLRDVVHQRRSSWIARVKDPDLIISIDVVQSVCCLSILKDFYNFRKYNLFEVVIPKPSILPERTNHNPTIEESSNNLDQNISSLVVEKPKQNELIGDTADNICPERKSRSMLKVFVEPHNDKSFVNERKSLPDIAQSSQETRTYSSSTTLRSSSFQDISVPGFSTAVNSVPSLKNSPVRDFAPENDESLAHGEANVTNVDEKTSVLLQSSEGSDYATGYESCTWENSH